MDSVENTTPLSGILKVTLIQTRDLLFPRTSSTPPGSRFLRGPHPYAIVDFDKSQVISHARYPSVYEPPVWAGEEKSPYIRSYTYSFDVTRHADLQIWLYQPTARGANVNTDVFLGKAAFRPLLTENSGLTQEWLNLHNGVGAISIMNQFISTESLTTMTPSLEPFDIREYRKSLSSLAIAVIYRKKNTNQDYAFIVLRKGKHDSVALRPAATQIDSPFITPLKFRIEVPKGKHYIACAYLHKYNLSEYLQSGDCLELTEARFYAAQILCALDCLHDLKIVYGRLQPRNIYIDLTGYLFLGDFDLYIHNVSGNRVPWPQPLSHDVRTMAPNNTDNSNQQHIDIYSAPELLATQGDGHYATPTADWWSFGVILHQMLTGCLPCNAANNADKALRVPDPPNGISLSQAAKDLLSKLLCRDPLQRLGANGSEEIKSHPFFDETDWPKLLKKDYIPGFRPPLEEPILPEGPCCEPNPSEAQISSAEQDRFEAVWNGLIGQAQYREG